MKKTKAAEPEQTAPARSKTAVRGKYFNTLQEHGSNLVIIDPALHSYFPDSESVNRALRAFLALGESMQALNAPRRRPASATYPVREAKTKQRITAAG